MIDPTPEEKRWAEDKEVDALFVAFLEKYPHANKVYPPGWGGALKDGIMWGLAAGKRIPNIDWHQDCDEKCQKKLWCEHCLKTAYLEGFSEGKRIGRESAIEECAKVADIYNDIYVGGSTIANAIRALKERGEG